MLSVDAPSRAGSLDVSAEDSVAAGTPRRCLRDPWVLEGLVLRAALVVSAVADSEAASEADSAAIEDLVGAVGSDTKAAAAGLVARPRMDSVPLPMHRQVREAFEVVGMVVLQAAVTDTEIQGATMTEGSAAAVVVAATTDPVLTRAAAPGATVSR